MNTTTKKFFKIGCYITIVIFIIRCIFGWAEIQKYMEEKRILNMSYSVFGYIGESMSLSAILMALFNNYFWKNKLINRIVGNIPVLEGKYIGKIKYSLDGRKKHKDIEININQTFLECVVKLNTNESESTSINATFVNVNNENELIYTYINSPKIEFRKNSPIHYGTVMLKTKENKIYGTYYTDRNTSGDIEASAVEKNKI